MVDRLEALGGEVLDEVLTAQTGQKAVRGEKQGGLDGLQSCTSTSYRLYYQSKLRIWKCVTVLEQNRDYPHCKLGLALQKHVLRDIILCYSLMSKQSDPDPDPASKCTQTIHG